MEKNKIVLDAKIARGLLKRGCQIVDIKPQRDNKERTAFVFKGDDLFWMQFERLTKNK